MIITNATLITLWDRQPLIEGALVAIEGKTIVDFGRVGKLIDRYEDTEILDVKGRMLMPGLIDGHTHLWRSLAPGLPVSGSCTFSELQEKFWWKYASALTEADTYVSALIGLLDSVRAGFTCIIDHHSSPNAIKGILQTVRRAFSEVGVRGCLSYSVSDWGGEDGARVGIAENQSFLSWCRAQNSDMVRGLFGIEASFSASRRTLDQVAETVRESDCGVHVHVSEDISDLMDARSKYQQTPTERLASSGLLGKTSLAAHCIHLEDSDYDRLKDTGAAVVQCPQSNAFHAVGAGDMRRLRSAGTTLALGTDGFSNSLFEEFRAAVLQQRAKGRTPSEALEIAFRSAFADNADLASRLFGPPLGRIRPGARADLVVVDYVPSTPLTAANLADHLFAGIARSPVSTVIINGKIVYRDGVFPNLDEARIRARARQTAKRVWERM